jgi:hypothetical protein
VPAVAQTRAGYVDASKRVPINDLWFGSELLSRIHRDIIFSQVIEEMLLYHSALTMTTQHSH